MKTHAAYRFALFSTAIAASFATIQVSAAASPPANLGGGLRALVARYEAAPAQPIDKLADLSRVVADAQGRVRVDIHADGRLPLFELAAQLQKAGLDVRTVYPAWRNGVISAFLPLPVASEVARMRGVSSVILSHRPVTDVGATTSQGAAVMKSDQVNMAGTTGKGITVGVMSDSYNTHYRATARALDDVVSGDLPKLINSSSLFSPGVKFLIEGPSRGSDEGRAMAQIVHDVAPGADLCFATAYDSQPAFAQNIVALRTDPACYADVIVDDVIYYGEPMFSDGIIAQAVDEVSTSTTLAGKPVVYFSSAGNRGSGYTSDFRVVPEAQARGELDQADRTVDLATIPAEIDTRGGFQDFDPGEGIDISQDVTCAGGSCTIDFQWDDPFDIPQGMTTDFNLLVFDADGRYVSSLSLTEDNFATSEPLEISDTALSADTSYRFVIARTGAGSQQAMHLKYVFFGGSLLSEYNDAPGANASTFGHNSATWGNGTAAYVYDDVPVDVPPYDGYTPSIETFSSPGPATIYLDASGARLAEADIRPKPALAAPDGVNTTFFPSGALTATDYEGDGYPNFFGTSAAAPHAAAVAALLLDAAGGPSTLTPAEVVATMQATTPARDSDPLYSRARAGKNLTVSASGGSATDPEFFTITLGGRAAELTTLTIDVTATGLQFDPDPATGYPLTVGATTGPTITSPSPTQPSSVLRFSFSGFAAGNSLSFGIDRDIAVLAGYGNSADLLKGAIITATFADRSNAAVGSFFNKLGTGYIYADGYGLIDAEAAVDAVP
jgi:hypothetical protein